VDSRVGEPGDDARNTWYIPYGLKRSKQHTYSTRATLPMFQQLLQLIIPNKPRSYEIQIPKPNQLTLMFTHSSCTADPPSGGIDNSEPFLDFLLNILTIGRRVDL
jgi:hypothetical protein